MKRRRLVDVVDAEPLQDPVAAGAGAFLLSDVLHVDEARLHELLERAQDGGAALAANVVLAFVIAVLVTKNDV